MKRVLKFTSDAHHYKAEVCLVWCYDNRFGKLLRVFLKQQKIRRYDLVMVAGGAKSLASPSHHPDTAFVIDQIRKSIVFHNTPRLIVMNHEDCGGYGGSKAFGNDAEKERHVHIHELRKALRVLRRAFPQLHTEALFADFKGVLKV